MSLQEEVNKRRTFAIISHPDAGKTTLTEKLLLYGGAIHLAGSVKARKTSKHAVSDWMEIEKQRGISVTSSVLQFDYEGHRINILDTPGHQDFSEDTYRTLMAADSAVMLIDVAKGVEAQTKKLFKVCRERGIPIFTFVNKIDHFGRNPFDIMDEIETVLGIRAYPMNWPLGVNGSYEGIYDRTASSIELFEKDTNHGQRKLASTKGSADDPAFKELLSDEVHQSLIDDIELLDAAGDAFDMEKVKNGTLTPMFFGSAMTNFGVKPFLEKFLELAPKPQPRKTKEGSVDPMSEQFTSFIFKIQANMNPQHHDRIVFMRIPVTFADFPTFPAELFARIRAKDSMKRKQFLKGMTQLAQEGAVQIYENPGSMESYIVGAVGQLQFEVLEYRLLHEYGVTLEMNRLPYSVAKWIYSQDRDYRDLKNIDSAMIVKDHKQRIVLLITNEWQADWIIERNPDFLFCSTPDELPLDS